MRPSPSVRLMVASWPDDAPRGAVKAFCDEHDVSPAWFHKIRKLAREEGQARAVSPASTRPIVSPNRTSDSIVLLAVNVRAQLEEDGLDCGPLSVLARLRRMGFTELPSRATLARIFLQAGLVVPEPKKKPRRAYRRFVYPAPNCLWQIDATEWTLADGTGCTIFQLIDDHSRLALASLVARGETSEAAVRVVKQAVERHGVPQKFLSDNGVAFNPTRRGYTSQLVDYLRELGVEAITGKPYKPTTQGKNERFHRTLHKYLNARPAAATVAELQSLVDDFDNYYNREREHQALAENSTPQEAWSRTPPAVAPVPVIETIADQNAAITTPPGEARLVVRSGGRITLLGIKFRIGAAYLGETIHAIWNHKKIAFYDTRGALIIEHPMPAKGTRYVANGRAVKRPPSQTSTKS